MTVLYAVVNAASPDVVLATLHADVDAEQGSPEVAVQFFGGRTFWGKLRRWEDVVREAGVDALNRAPRMAVARRERWTLYLKPA